jgi:hypothetical protein
VETFDLAAGLRVIRGRVLGLRAHKLELGFEDDLAAAGVGGKDGPVAGEQRLRQAPGLGGGQEAEQHIGGLESGQYLGGDQQPGVVVDQVEDLDLAAIGEGPEGEVALPGLVGQVGLEACEGCLGPLVRLGDDEALALEDPADGGSRGQLLEAFGEVVEDGLGAGVEAGRGQLPAELEDGGLDLRIDLVWTRPRPVRARLEGGEATFSVAREQAEQPTQ